MFKTLLKFIYINQLLIYEEKFSATKLLFISDHQLTLNYEILTIFIDNSFYSILIYNFAV